MSYFKSIIVECRISLGLFWEVRIEHRFTLKQSSKMGDIKISEQVYANAF